MTRHSLALAFFCSTALSCTAPAYADNARAHMPQIYTMTPMGVNLQSGTFVHSETDFTIGSLSFVRSWRAVPTISVPASPMYDDQSFGAWNHNFGFSARWHPTRSNGAEVYADGKVYQFVRQADLSWIPWNIDQHNNNAFGTLLTGAVDSNLVFRNHNGDVYTFNTNNQATQVVYADGSRIDLTYDASRRLRTVISNRGDAIVLEYNGNGRLGIACGFNRALVYVDASRTCSQAGFLPHVKVNYAYTATSAAQGFNLTSVTSADGQVTQMTYDSYFRPNVTCITLPGSSPSPSGCRITNVYGPQPNEDPVLTGGDQVRRQTTATGEIWQYFYLNANLYADWPPIVFGEVRQTESTMTDPLGRTTHAEYENGFLIRLYAPEGLTQYAWASLNPSQFTQPGGNSERLNFDFRNNVVERRRIPAPGSSEPEIVSTATYPDSVFGLANGWATGCVAASQRLCNKPTQTVAERPAAQIADLTLATDYTYDPAHGGVLTATRPAPAIGAVRPKTTYTYTQIATGVMNAAGTGLTTAPTGVWVLTQESECRTQATCSGTSDEVRTVYHYGASGEANALRLRGRTVTDNTNSHRTCFTYDAVGNRISETGPGAQLASCPAQ